MSSYAEKMKRERNTVQDCYMQYNEIRRKKPKAFIAFLEGYDAPYYLPFIASIIGSEPEQVICHNKKNVIGIYNSLYNKKMLIKAKTGFFIDRDFDINSTLIKNIQDFYVTRGYSVENYYCSKKAIERILKNHLHYNCTHRDYDILVGNYIHLQKQFNLAILDFNAYLCSIRRNNVKVDWSLSDCVPSKYVEVDYVNFKVNKKCNLAIIHHDYPANPQPTTEEMERNKKWIIQDYVMNLRGKYEFAFLVKYLRSLPAMVKDPATAFEEHSMQFSIGDKEILSALAQYADKDEDLSDYIRKRAA